MRYDTVRPARIEVARGLAFEALGRPADARKAYEHAIELNAATPLDREQGDDDPRVSYGAFLFRAGQAEAALVPLKDAAAASPGSSRARLELGRTLFQLGRAADAAAELAAAVRLDPRSAPAALLFGKVLRQLGRDAEAQAQLERGRALASQP